MLFSKNKVHANANLGSFQCLRKCGLVMLIGRGVDFARDLILACDSALSYVSVLGVEPGCKKSQGSDSLSPFLSPLEDPI